ncbi:cation-transporting P-type ATPase [Chitinispirillales bacterium ANBcel5]|uniref:cation-transporting P-type ATPase n=1 Tax=Cellulosispirillum alkaliphilum TaxID=3039283 RepID=UPI002A530A3C|nr:cation-transporting P-type ATPase [Chitinispirillales bacterium ANBcel5]
MNKNSVPKTDDVLAKPYAYSPEKVLASLGTSQKGLKELEAEARLSKYGPNRLPQKKDLHPFLKFLKHFNNILIYVLLVAAVITALLDHWVDTWIILAVVIINSAIGFLQEGKAEKALEAVKKMLSMYAHVKRDGAYHEVAGEVLVPGDIIKLKSGDKVPADVRLLDVKSLRVNEASLTGESEEVEKNTEALDENTPLGDRFSMAYSGTIVSSGQGTGVVCATGSSTELGKINTMLSEVKTITTPLLKQIAKFGRQLTAIILAFGVVTFLVGYFIADYQLDEIFLAVVGLAVAAIPEGLPAIITIILAIGVQRMASRNAIIRLLPGVETLGSVSVICSDKTGTLTKGEMTAKKILTRNTALEVSGGGYAPEGEFLLDGKKTDPLEDKNVELLLRACMLCNDARLKKDKEEGWSIEGAPTEGALITLATKASLKTDPSFKRVDTLPFESEHKFMATLNEAGEGSKSRIIFLKGAPERVLSRCQYQGLGEGKSEEIDREWWDTNSSNVASEGLRLLAIAFKEVGNDQSEIDFAETADGFTLLGMVGLIDPPREEVIASVQECREAGVRVKMITGDHALTARAIASKIGIGDGKTVMSGPELDETDDNDLPDIAERVDVFARVSPEHKLRLVQALQKKGRVTAMTGDGVNDAPALKRADIGIAMGIKGTEASKEAAVMVLADDNFSSITNAVEEGRTVYDNLRKSLLFILPTNGGQGLIIITAILLGIVLPITPAQILWVNMVTAVTLALALAFEPMEKDVMKRKPRNPKDPLLSKSMLLRITYVSVLLNILSLSMFTFFSRGYSYEYASTMAVNTLIAGEVFYLFNSRFLKASVINFKGIIATKYVWGTVLAIVLFQALFTYLPLFQTWFGTEGIAAVHWLPMIGAGLILFFLVELEKFFVRIVTAEKK